MFSLKSMIVAVAVALGGTGTAALADECGPRRGRGWDRRPAPRQHVRHDRHDHHRPRSGFVVRFTPPRPPAVRIVIGSDRHRHHGWVDHRRGRGRGCR